MRALHEELLDDLAPAGSLRYVAEPVEADAALRRGDALAVYLLPPTTPGRIRAVVERGERLPLEVDLLLAEAPHGHGHDAS